MQPKRGERSTNYINLLIAFGAGLVWAFFWAVDATISYLAFGACSFFLILFFYNRKINEENRAGGNKKTVRTPSWSVDRNKDERPASTTSPSERTSQLVRLSVFGIAVSIIAVVAYTIFTSDPSASEGDSNYLYSMGEEHYSAEKYDSAYYYYKAAVRLDEDMAEAWLGLGNSLHMLNQKDSSLILYNKALSINPENKQARYNIGWWYYDQKQYRQSIDYLKVLVEEDPSQLNAMQLVGDDFYEMAQYDSALRWYNGAYTNGARSRWLCHVMAYIYDKNNQVDQAIPLYKEALEYDDSLVEIYVRLGELLPGNEGEEYRIKAAQLKAARGGE